MNEQELVQQVEQQGPRPADLLFPDRVTAGQDMRCIASPLGCGKPIGAFRDEISKREYTISRLCQQCQDEVFSGGED